MMFPRVRKQTVAATNADHDLYLLTKDAKSSVAMKLAGAPTVSAKNGVVEPSGTKNSMSPRNDPVPAPIAAGSVSAVTAKNTGMKAAMKSWPTPHGVRM